MSILNSGGGIKSPISAASEYTLSAWVFTAGSGDEVYMGVGQTGTYALRRNGGTIMVRNYRGTNTAEIYVNGIAVTGAWAHHAVVVSTTDAAKNKLYYNGTSTSSVSALVTTDITQLFLHTQVYDAGSNTRNANNHRIANAGWWSAILTDAEIASLGKGCRPARVRPQALINECLLVRDNRLTRGGAWTNVASYSPQVHPHPRIF